MALGERRRKFSPRPGDYDPEFIEQLKSTHKLWHERTPVIVPRYAAFTVESVKLYGMAYSEGQTKEERSNYNKEMVKVYMAPIRHVMLYDQGIPIAYPSRERAALIYFHIKNHVRTWSELLGSGMNVRSKAPPPEDFELLLDFAQNLEKFLKFYYRANTKDNFFGRATMNRFANDERYSFKEDSTYNKLRSGIFGMLTERQERVDAGPARIVRTDSSPDNFTENDEFSLSATVDRIRNT